MDKLSYKKDRAFTEFQCGELLYDYFSEQLNAERKSEFENFLKTNDEFKEEFENFKFALDYCEGLSKTNLTELAVKKVVSRDSSIVRLRKLLRASRWERPIVWAGEAIVVGLAVVMFSVYVPWDKYFSFRK